MPVLVTGVAGFIGYHLADALLTAAVPVIGVDNLNDYYDPALKRARLERLQQRPGFDFRRLDIADRPAVAALFADFPGIRRVAHLAAQAGVRYSLQNPLAYVRSNIEGHVVLLEEARRLPALEHFVYASSSSVYGGNEKRPFAETDRTDCPVSLYGASKKAMETVSQSYAAMYRMPLTGLRFFTVYGPWGRPDMAVWIFTRKIIAGEPLPIFNHGRQRRDFTYIDDIVRGITACLDLGPDAGAAVPHRLFNLGNNRPSGVLDLVHLLEDAIGIKAVLDYQPHQLGDVTDTHADIDRAAALLGFAPSTRLDEGIPAFVRWYRRYHAG
ncbi:MAG: NAD-dependent epimerase/dehydratase family protein [Rhodospirillales bacterium]